MLGPCARVIARPATSAANVHATVHTTTFLGLLEERVFIVLVIYRIHGLLRHGSPYLAGIWGIGRHPRHRGADRRVPDERSRETRPRRYGPPVGGGQLCTAV